MCGIAGSFGVADADAIRRMIRALAHRGPDDEGVWTDPSLPAAFGHRRLSILDLSSAGHQPMSDPSGRLWIVFNGEIYNYRDLRRELEARGRPFRTQSDTEVILAAYAEWGPTCVTRLRGMFAMAIADRAPGSGAPSLLLARDRLGIKPLLYHLRGSELWFASELRALVAGGRLEPRVRADAIVDFLAFGSVSQPGTVFEGVKALPPGHWMEVRGSDRRLVSYWDLHDVTAGLRRELAGVDEEEARLRLRAALEEATRYHLIADVPVGAFFSGGIDSTAIVGLMSRVSGRRIRTLSVGYESDSGDERSFAGQAAARLGTEHREVVVRETDVVDLFPKIVEAIDQPSVDGANTWIVSRAARADFPVALSGLGGDELMAGYGHFGLLARADRESPVGSPVAFGCWRRVREIGRVGRQSYRRFMAAADPAERRGLARSVLAPHQLRRAFAPGLRDAVWQRIRAGSRPWFRAEADSVQRTSYAEVQGYLLNTLLRDGDCMSMAHALEMRPVLLDHPLVELLYALPERLKLREGRTKYLFVRAVEDILGPETVGRRKMGFELPYAAWMGSARCLRPLIEDLLESAPARALFGERCRASLRIRLAAGRPPEALWGWSMLLLWLEQGGHELPPIPGPVESDAGAGVEGSR